MPGLTMTFPSDAAAAVLREIEALLQRLATSGEGGTIDLGGLPLYPGDREFLERTLGWGEVEATVDAFGPSRVRETGVGGVWWVEHRNEDSRMVAELIEVAHVPTILFTPSDDVRDGLTRLRSRLENEQAGNPLEEDG